MKEDGEGTMAGYDGKGVRGWGWALFGVVTAGVAKYVMGDGGGLFGGGCRGVATQRDLDYERKLTEANAETAALQAKLDCNAAVLASERRYEDKFDAIEKQINDLSSTQAVFNANTMAAIGVVGQQAKQLAAMTTTIIGAPSILASEAAAKAALPSASTTTTTGN